MKSIVIDLKLLALLLFYWVAILIAFVFLSKIAVALFFYFSNGNFYFAWTDALDYAIKAGLGEGIPLACGIWVMSKLGERKKSLLPPKG
ncbi:hypothetical protein [Sodalis sp. RH16]|uniref:hypothetical protein n=1 Tax=Sodalis sp. RH16 TaxID=3394331 RepID=UPI0039B5ED56